MWGGGERGAPILYACLASVLSFIHLELEKYVLGITQTHPYGIDLYTTEWFFFLPNININEDLRRKYDTENSFPRIKVSPKSVARASLQMGVLCRLGFVTMLKITIWDFAPLWP